MISIGFLIFVLGFLYINVVCHKCNPTQFDLGVALVTMAGLILMVIGVAKWLWENMP